MKKLYKMNPFKKEKKQISLFTTAGYPELNSLKTTLPQLEAQGIDFIEVGIPFSDPMADGPVIQQTSSIALKNGMQLDILFNQLKEIQTNIPLVLMGYLNPVLKFGLDKFLKQCNAVGVRCVILPDMSLEIYKRYYQATFEVHGVHPSFLITPSTPDDRIRKVAEVCSNSFVYLVSNNATTGSTNAKVDQTEAYNKAKQLCADTPLFIGFGIKTKADVAKVHEVADGAIIGSAYLRAVEANKAQEFVESLFIDS